MSSINWNSNFCTRIEKHWKKLECDSYVFVRISWLQIISVVLYSIAKKNILAYLRNIIRILLSRCTLCVALIRSNGSNRFGSTNPPRGLIYDCLRIRATTWQTGCIQDSAETDYRYRAGISERSTLEVKTAFTVPHNEIADEVSVRFLYSMSG